MEIIPTITLWQPWASLIALGEKKIETRSWPVHKNYRGPLAIHASAKVPGWAKELWGQEPFLSALKEQATVPVGAIIAVCNLTDCVKITREYRYTLTDQELAFGDYSQNRYAWILRNAHALKTSIPAKGRQGLWNWDATPHLVTIDPYMIGSTKIWTPSGIRQGKIVSSDREDAVSGLEVVSMKLDNKINPCLTCYFDWKDYCDAERRLACLVSVNQGKENEKEKERP